MAPTPELISPTIVFSSEAIARSQVRPFGKYNVICGPNGSGKTTLLKYVASGHALPHLTPNNFLENVSRIAQGAIEKEALLELLREGFSQLHDEVLDMDQLIPVRSISDHLISKLAATSREIVCEGTREAISSARTFADEHLFSGDIVEASRNLITTKNVPTNNVVMGPLGHEIIEYLYFAKMCVEAEPYSDGVRWVRDAFARCTDGLEFDAKAAIQSAQKLDLFFKYPSGKEIFAESSGFGLRIALGLLAAARFAPQPVMFIEEAETHLHPELAVRLFSIMTTETEKTIFVTTHANFLLRSSLQPFVLLCDCQSGLIRVSDCTDRVEQLSALGYSVLDNLCDRVIVFVEGPSDCAALSWLLDEMLKDRTRRRRFSVRAVGGDIMRFERFDYIDDDQVLFAILDNEESQSSISARQEFSKSFKARSGRDPFVLQRRSLDNYWSLDAYRTYFLDFVTNWKEVPATAKLDGLPKRYKQKTVALAKETGLEGLRGTDLYQVLEQIAKAIADD